MIKFKTLRIRIFTTLSSIIILVAGFISFYLMHDLQTRSYQAFNSVTQTINDAFLTNIQSSLNNADRKDMITTLNTIRSPYIKNMFILNHNGKIMVTQNKYEASTFNDISFQKLLNSKEHKIKSTKQHLILNKFIVNDNLLGYFIVEGNLTYYGSILYKELQGLVIMIMSFFILTLSIAYYLSRSLSQPLYNMIYTLKNTKDNEALVFQEESEKEFNYLINSITNKHNSLLLLNIKLEEKIKDKTVELQDLNKNLKNQIEKAVKVAKEREEFVHRQTRLAQIGEMISMIAHQWRQPLTTISSTMMLIDRYIEIGKYDLSKQLGREDFIRFLNTKHNSIYEHIDYLSSTTDDFRNLFNPHTRKSNIMLNTPLNKALKLIANSMKNQNINLTLTLNSVESCELYENEIMQVILNILKNASDALGELLQGKKNLCIETYDTKTCSILKICDNAMGISSDIQEKIFDPYFSTKNQKTGTGLGLYMSKNIVEEHNNGKLDFKTSTEGTCFSLSFKYKAKAL